MERKTEGKKNVRYKAIRKRRANEVVKRCVCCVRGYFLSISFFPLFAVTFGWCNYAATVNIKAKLIEYISSYALIAVIYICLPIYWGNFQH